MPIGVMWSCTNMHRSSKDMRHTTSVESGISDAASSVENKIIKVSIETHRKLLKLGSKGETFDDIIKRLIKEHEERSGHD